MCRRFSIRMAVLMLVLCFTFVQVTEPPRKVYATGMDIIVGGGGFIALETALAWLLGILGFTATSALIYENRDALLEWGGDRIDEFLDFCENVYDGAQITVTQAYAWLEDVASGTLDKASEVYDAFKAWAVSASQGTDADITSIVNVTYDVSQATVIRNYSNNYGYSITWNNDSKCFIGYPYIIKSNSLIKAADVPLTAIQVLGTCNYDTTFYSGADFGASLQDFIYHGYDGGYDGYVNTTANLQIPYAVQVGDYTVYLTDAVFNHGDYINTGLGKEKFRTKLVGSWISVDVGSYSASISDALLKFAAMTFLDYKGLLTDGFFVSQDAVVSTTTGTQNVLDRDGTLENVDIVSPYETDDELVVVLPWDTVGTLAPDGTIDLPFDSTGALVTDVPIALPVDTTTNTVLDTDIPVEDVITSPSTAVDTSVFEDYTITGLESFFPFCIPFDFINFLNVLDAEPETPCFEWEMTFMQDLGFEPYTMVIDLSIFNGVATVCRNMELFLFIVGLILATRSRFIRA